ncbi:SDR family oxidoreductase [Dysgonomonas sp. 25]|uniref:SDR family oxidoreductase n=1 Tax=Dysgonomonas sp. 25 TaxID=2302933 RepID=UPI0013D6A73D|nr:SDR family oxidoreductase [Dysgonomonas sp. 25]NDV67423.1 SDR family oxidoreductase [Dysgonomonas sp. 25]
MKNELFRIEGKVVVITGGYGILGSNIAKYLASEGAYIAILGRSREKGDLLANTIKSTGGEASFFSCNVMSKEDLERCNTAILELYGKIDILINAAGGNMPGATIPADKTIFDVNVEDLRKVIDLNLFGTILPSLTFAKSMVDNGKGNIINIASMSSFRPLTRVMGYGIAKAAVANFTQYMAGELSGKFGDQFRVNAIAPGFFITTQNHDLMLNSDGSYSERAQSILAHTPFHRFGEADELLGIIHYLASDASSFVNGSIIEVDGGFNAFSI